MDNGSVWTSEHDQIIAKYHVADFFLRKKVAQKFWCNQSVVRQSVNIHQWKVSEEYQVNC